MNCGIYDFLPTLFGLLLGVGTIAMVYVFVMKR